MLSETAQLLKGKRCVTPLRCDSGTELNGGGQGPRCRGVGLSAGDHILVLFNDKVTEIDVGDGCATVRIYLMP